MFEFYLTPRLHKFHKWWLRFASKWKHIFFNLIFSIFDFERIQNFELLKQMTSAFFYDCLLSEEMFS